MLTGFLHLALLGFTSLVSTAGTPSVPVVQAAPVLYRLDITSAYVEGCQEPCKCPLWLTDDLLGTLVLKFDNSDPAGFDHYAVTNVNWVLGFGAAEKHITGQGEFRIGGQFALLQQLTLDLVIDGELPVHFDSGLVPSGAAFPTIDVAIAMNNFFCFDRVFAIHASPVPKQEIVPYRLRGSNYIVGCQAPCYCLIKSYPTSGTFGLVDLGPVSNPAQLHYALVDMRLQTQTTPPTSNQKFKGTGLYTVDTGTGEHRLICDLVDSTSAPVRFDSGLVLGGLAFPAKLDVAVAVNGFYCFDQVLDLRAWPQ